VFRYHESTNTASDIDLDVEQTRSHAKKPSITRYVAA
jgi:hypothetical protein